MHGPLNVKLLHRVSCSLVDGIFVIIVGNHVAYYRNVNIHPENVKSPLAGPLICVANFFCHFTPLFQCACGQLRFI